MTPAIEEALMWQGIEIFRGRDRWKSRCPVCSYTRLKKMERCMSVKLLGDAATLFCYHCGYEGVVS